MEEPVPIRTQLADQEKKTTKRWMLYLAQAGHSSITGVDDDAHSRVLDRALRFRQIAVSVHPKSWPACEALYHALVENGDPAAARGAVETLLESVPGHQEAMQILEETSPPKSDD